MKFKVSTVNHQQPVTQLLLCLKYLVSSCQKLVSRLEHQVSWGETHDEVVNHHYTKYDISCLIH